MIPPQTSVPHWIHTQEEMDAAGGRGSDEEAEVWRSRLYRYLAGLMESDASVAADYHELQV